MPETKDLILRKAVFEDWQDMYRNLWSHGESARYMLWNVTRTEEEAQARIARTIAFQEQNRAWLVIERKSGQAIGFAGMMQISDGVWEDTGIAVGPEFVGRGYGKQILTALIDFAVRELGASVFICSCRSENAASRGMILGCGFRYTHTEDRIDPRNGQKYFLEFYQMSLLRRP